METTYEEKLEREYPTERASWLDKPLTSAITLNAETILFAIILILAIFSRFYLLEPRVMSHDENSHVYYSWQFYKGQGFTHNPLMHGTLQFHLIALTYFMFGDNDFTARIPAVLFSIATVWFVWKYRRYLGRSGALVSATLMTISPYMLFYGRYVRNEAFVAFFGVVTLWAILRYLETGQARYLYWLTAATVLHFTAKETSFIYTAQALLFLFFYFINRLFRNPWPDASKRSSFLISLVVGLLLLGGAGTYLLLQRSAATVGATETAAPAVPNQPAVVAPAGGLPVVVLILVGLSLAALLAAAYFAIRGYTWQRLRAERSFGILVVLGTMVLPQLSAFPIRFAGWKIPTTAAEVANLTTTDIWHMALFLAPLFILSVVIGLLWNRRVWLINAGIWYALFTIFYTSVFTNGAGFFTGMVGSLGYWLEQQGVNRGSQPWYYYALIQIPQYEYLPALGSLLAFGLALFGLKRPARARVFGVELGAVDALQETPDGQVEPEGDFRPLEQEKAPVLSLLGFWVVTSLIAYTLAGEKMPWLTVHITLPMILLAGWAIGWVIDAVDWSMFRQRRGWLVIALLLVFLISLAGVLSSLLGINPPFQGSTLDQLQATSTFLLAFASMAAAGVGLYAMVRTWPSAQFTRLITLFVFAILGLLTAHAAIRSSYINYDRATELLVYAHSADGVKEALGQIEELSKRTTGGLSMPVAYDNETSYPYLWYLRNFTDARFFGADPTRSVRDASAILVGDANYDKIEPVVRNDFYEYDYIRLWWPNQDYFGLTWQRVLYALRTPQMRKAIFDIWLNADYKAYGKATNTDTSLVNWSPAARMRLYIRKDIAAKLWNYGSAAAAPIQADPYQGKSITLAADRVFGSPGSEPGQLTHPHDLALAPDGASLYVADTDNHRIQHLSLDGTVLQVWGSFGDIATGAAAGGTFNQPWGIATGPDGSVYVADTWNHRIQKFTATGEFVKMWGFFGQAEQADAFWGPRDVAVDAQGRVLVTDTGNKRVVVFDKDGNYITQFGETGLGPGQFDEPVGLALDADGNVYVADTWNQRIQVFAPTDTGEFKPLTSWDVSAWFGQSLNNKPYLAVDGGGHVFATDPEGYRVLEFNTDGQFIRYWGDFGTGPDTFGLAGSVAVDPKGGVWVSDAGNSRLMHFTLPGP